MRRILLALTMVVALTGLQVSSATAAAELDPVAVAPAPIAAGPAAQSGTITTAAVPIVAPNVTHRYHTKAGKKLRAKVGDKCAKKWLAKYSYWSSDVLLCGGIGIAMPGWGIVCGVGMFVGGEFVPFDKACK